MEEIQLFKSKGVLKYTHETVTNYKLVVSVEQDIADFYRSLIPKAITVKRQSYPAHISVVRKEIPVNVENWGKYEGEEIEFEYANLIHSNVLYYWINAFSIRLEQIRVELGLPISSVYTRPLPPYQKVFHITIGNIKE